MKRALLLGLIVALCATSAMADAHPNTQNGVAIDRAFSSGDVDNVNLFNGSLTLSIPLTTFTVSEHLSYSLTLYYNSNPWQFSDTDYQGTTYTIADPSPCSNAGLGWRLSLGRLRSPCVIFGGIFEAYESADGAIHNFYPRLHETDGEDAGDSPTLQNVQYTRDGSYLRLTKIAGGFKIEFPDGGRHEFDSQGRLSYMYDAFGNWVHVVYSASSWTITDSTSRPAVVVSFNTVAPNYVSNISVPTFGAGTANYPFTYDSTTSFRRGCPFNAPAAVMSLFVTVPVLTSIGFPLGTSYSATATDYIQPTSGTCGTFSASLQGLNLRTGGRIEWQYAWYKFPTASTPKAARQSNPGVIRRTLLDQNGIQTDPLCVGPVVGTNPSCFWSYAQSPTTFGPTSLQSITTVTDPHGNYTKNYFSVATSTNNGGDPSEYGAQISRDPTAGSIVGPNGIVEYLSSRTTKSDGLVKQTDYVAYEHDTPTTTSSDSIGTDAANANRRALQTRSVYDKDAGHYADTYHSTSATSTTFDGLGHYRLTLTDGNYDSANQRTTETKFNPGVSSNYPVYHVNQTTGALDVANAITPAPVIWMLNGLTAQSVTEAGVTATTEYCYEGATGFVLGKRTLRNSGVTENANDVLARYGHEAVGTANAGNLSSEDYYGADSQNLPATCNAPGLAAQYRLTHTSQYGVRATSQYSGASFLSLNQVIDQSTSLTSSSADSSGLSTVFAYDALRRLTSSTAPGETPINYIYTNPSGSGGTFAGANVEIRRGAGTGTLPKEIVYLDALGREQQNATFLPGGPSAVVTKYDGFGHKTFTSEMGSTVKGTTYSNFDAFGLGQTITLADGELVNRSQYGTREFRKNFGIATAVGSESRQITIETYDRQGRLFRVTEPNGIITQYSYNPLNQLTQVCQNYNTGTGTCGQIRTFTYDLRGFLSSEQHPEKGASGNGSVSYFTYDARGHAHRKLDGPNDLTYFFDSTERVTRIKETSGLGRDLKTFTYSTANALATNGYSNGKLLQSKRFNYVLANNTPVTDEIRYDYTYGSSGSGADIGRVVQRVLNSYFNGGASSFTYSQSFAYTGLGDLASVGYPLCTAGSCPTGTTTPRTVSFGYNRGVLTSITGYATLSYWPNGQLSQVVHTTSNSLTDTIAMDTNSMARPASFTSGPAAGGTNWSTGPYNYDSAGNIKQIGTGGNFVYDAESRLTQGTVFTNPTSQTGPVSQTITYDAYGNNSLAASSASTNRLTGSAVVGGNCAGSAADVIGYDGAGNLTCYHNITFAYDAFNQMTHACFGGPCLTTTGPLREDWTYMYDADDERVYSFKNFQGVFRHTLRDLGGLPLRDAISATSSSLEEYIYRGSQLLAAETTSSGRLHFSLDHLGTPRLITTQIGSTLAYHQYLPYGQEATSTAQDAEVLKFTGHERDFGASGALDDLDYMHARHASPLTGRFLSIDPILDQKKAAANPEQWNRYSYAMGNPVRFSDPKGLCVDACVAEGLAAAAIVFAESPEGQELIESGEVEVQEMAGLAAEYAKPALERGYALEQAIAQRTGGALERFFPTIDRIKDRVITSVKSVDLAAPTYQNLARLSSRLQGYLGKLADFEGGGVPGGMQVGKGQWDTKVLEIVIQTKDLTMGQARLLISLSQSAARQGITLRIIGVN